MKIFVNVYIRDEMDDRLMASAIAPTYNGELYLPLLTDQRVGSKKQASFLIEQEHQK
jgi:hypothetical protein